MSNSSTLHFFAKFLYHQNIQCRHGKRDLTKVSETLWTKRSEQSETLVHWLHTAESLRRNPRLPPPPPPPPDMHHLLCNPNIPCQAQSSLAPMLKQITPNQTHMLHPKLFKIIIIILPFTFGLPVSHLPSGLSYNSVYAFVMSPRDKIFTSLKRADRLQGPPNLLFNWYQGLFKHLKTKRRLLYLKTQSVPRYKHFSSRL